MIIPEQRIHQKFVDLSDVIQESGKSGYDIVKNLLDRFDIEQSNRAVVKHYPIHSYCDGKAGAEWTLNNLDNMATAMYLSFFHYAKQALIEKHGDMLFEELMSDRKLGKILVCPPSTFSYTCKKIDKFTMYAFSRYIDEDDQTELRGEVNFTIQPY